MGLLRDADQVWAEFVEQASDPSTPAAGIQRLYFKTNGRLYAIDDAGVVTDLRTGAGVTFSPTGGISASTVQAAIAELDSEAEKVANKGVANGYASLDAGGKVPAAQIPVIAISETFAAANEAAMLALTAEVGDVAIRADEGDARYILAEAPATDVNNWIPLAHPADAVTSVAGKVGVVTLEAADLTDRDDVAVQDGTLSVGDLLVVKSLAPLVVEGVDSAAYEPTQLIAETVLGSDTATISFTSIPATFRHLVVVLEGRASPSQTSVGIGLRFNADTGNNYDRQTLQAVGTGVTATQTTGGSFIQIGLLSAATATANASGSIRVMIPSYRQTTFHKTMFSEGAAQASSIATQRNAGRWASTAAITQIDLLIPTGGNFLTGTVAGLYGLQGA